MYFPRLKELRVSSGLRQEDIAAYLGIKQTVYSRYERGAQTIPLEHLFMLSDIYHRTLDYITGREPS